MHARIIKRHCPPMYELLFAECHFKLCGIPQFTLSRSGYSSVPTPAGPPKCVARRAGALLQHMGAALCISAIDGGPSPNQCIATGCSLDEFRALLEEYPQVIHLYLSTAHRTSHPACRGYRLQSQASGWLCSFCSSSSSGGVMLVHACMIV